LLLRLTAVRGRKVVVVAEVLTREGLELFAGGAAGVAGLVGEGVDQPLDAMAAGVPVVTWAGGPDCVAATAGGGVFVVGADAASTGGGISPAFTRS
jgi:hypothetical protein